MLRSLLIALFLLSSTATAQIEVVDTPEGSRTQTGPEAARDYFKRRKGNYNPQGAEEPVNRRPALADRSHYMSIYLGTFVDDKTYRWGDAKSVDDPGKWNLGVTYRIGEWVNSMDLLFRADLTTYSLPEGQATKLSLLPVVTFPDANSRFPLYFGGGIGLGVFFKQIPDESALSLDYQLVAGARFFDLYEGGGFMIETGMKNHLFLMSDGQFNGVFVSAGAVFAF